MFIDDIDQKLEFASFFLESLDVLHVGDPNDMHNNRVSMVFHNRGSAGAFLMLHFAPAHIPALEELLERLRELQGRE